MEMMANTGQVAFVSAALATLFLAFPTADSRADPIQYDFGGVITSADPSTGVAVGSRFDGTFTIDPTAPVTAALLMFEGHIGYGMFSNSAITLFAGGNQFFSSNSVGLTVDYGPKFSATPSAQDPAFTSVGILGQTDQLGLTLTLTNPSQSVFPGYPMPTAFPLSDFPQASLSLIDRETLLGGTIDTLIPVPVPEPSSLALFVVTIGVLAFRKARAGNSIPSQRHVNRPDQALAQPLLADGFEVAPAGEERIDDVRIPLNRSAFQQNVVDLRQAQPPAIRAVA